MDHQTKPDWIDLESIIPLKSYIGARDAESITNLSEETIRREYAEYVVQLSPRRFGMKLRNVLLITKNGIKTPQGAPASAAAE